MTSLPGHRSGRGEGTMWSFSESVTRSQIMTGTPRCQARALREEGGVICDTDLSSFGEAKPPCGNKQCQLVREERREPCFSFGRL